MNESKHGAHLSPEQAIKSIPGSGGERYSRQFTHGSLEVEIYAPVEVDNQQPHRRDEAYVVIRGKGWFVHGDQRDRVGPGDFLFVPAGMTHRFEDFSDDLLVWVIFYGPDGGEFSRKR